MSSSAFQGMVDPGEEVTATLLREFAEETMSSGSVSATLRALNKSDKMAKIKELFFNHGTEVCVNSTIDVVNTKVSCRIYEMKTNVF